MKRLITLASIVFVVALVVGLLASRLFLTRPPAAGDLLTAQPGSTPESSLVTFEGGVSQWSAVVPSTWVVDQYRFRVVAQTEVITNGLTIQTGVWARVEALKDEQQTMEARTVELQIAPSGEIFDRVVSMNSATGVWQVGDTEVLVSGQTTIQGTPAVDALVYVKGQWSLAGLAADQAVVQSSVGQVIYQGKIVQQQATQWVVDDVVVDLSDSPSILGDPEIGAQVEVYGVETGPRHLRAQAIIVSSGETEFQRRDGWLVSIDGDDFPYLWRINLLEGTGIVPVYVAVFENTEIDETAATAGYRTWLDIQADHTGAGYYRARRIVALPRPPKQTITGIVEQMPASGTVGQWRISGHRVAVSDDTAIIGAPHLGSLVTVLGAPDYSNALNAESIEVLGE